MACAVNRREVCSGLLVGTLCAEYVVCYIRARILGKQLNFVIIIALSS